MESTGTIIGTVTDLSGDPLPGVLVTVTGEYGPRETVTDARGRYRVMQLPPGTYELKAEMTGFRTVVFRDVIVRSGQDTVRDVEMEPAVVTEE